MALIPVQPHEIEPGTPLRWNLLGADGRLLLQAGQVVADQAVLNQLLGDGVFREPQPAPPLEASLDPGSAQALSAARLQLNPGDLLQIQPQSSDGNSERYMVKVVGHLAPLSLMVTAPSSNGKLLFVREGHVFLVRGFIGQDAMAYRTRVLKTQLAPFPYLHLAYPDAVQSTRIRKSVRARVSLVIAINAPAGNSAGRITDLSLGGAKIISHAAFAQAGEEVRLAFRIDPGGIEIYLNIKALVRTNQAEQLDQAHHATGVEFVDLSSQDRLALMGVVYQNMLKDSF